MTAPIPTTPLKVTVSPGDMSSIALQGVDVKRFLKTLEAVASHTFKEVHVFTCWGLVIFQFRGPQGIVTNAVGLDVLAITKELVVKDDGTYVDRYAKIVEELYKRAHDKLLLPPDARELKRSSILTATH